MLLLANPQVQSGRLSRCNAHIRRETHAHRRAHRKARRLIAASLMPSHPACHPAHVPEWRYLHNLPEGAKARAIRTNASLLISTTQLEWTADVVRVKSAERLATVILGDNIIYSKMALVLARKSKGSCPIGKVDF
jgi:hypothetical protein